MGDQGDRDRMPFQVLVIPNRRVATRIRYAAFLRTDAGVWQFIAGGGSRGESKLQAVQREAREEAGIPPRTDFVELQSVASAPAHNFRARRYWPPDLSEIPESCFAVNAGGLRIRLSPEHSQVEWLAFVDCMERLYWESNRTALRALNERLGYTLFDPANPPCRKSPSESVRDKGRTVWRCEVGGSSGWKLQGGGVKGHLIPQGLGHDDSPPRDG